MIELKPFRAWRYNLDAIGDIANVVAPPYDKIPVALHNELLAKHEKNAVRLIKPVKQGETPEDLSPYEDAGRLWDAWRQDGTLVQDETPTLSIYTQHGKFPSGEVFERTCVQVAFKLQGYNADGIRRHEQTLSKPLGDRLHLMRTTRANLGQIFALYDDFDGKGLAIVQDALNIEPYGRIVDSDGTEHVLRVMTDPTAIQAFCDALRDSYLVIADGHHRYETALKYWQERKDADAGDDDEAAWVMLSLCGMQHPGLEILAGHRALNRCPIDEATLLERLTKSFDVSEVADFTKLHEGVTAADGGTIGWYSPSGKSRLLRAKAPSSDLDVAVLHQDILEDTIGFTTGQVRDEGVLSYLRDPAEAKQGVDAGQYHGAFLLRPTTMEQLQRVTDSGGVMPQKSTDFYPKVWSGFTMRSLESE